MSLSKVTQWVIATAALSLLLAGCAPSNTSSTPSSSSTQGTGSSATPAKTPASTPSVEPEPIPPSQFPCTTPAPTAETPSASQMELYQAVIETANTQPMVSTSCETITLILAGSSCCGPTPRDSALVQWGQWLNPTTASWTFNIDPVTLADWRTKAYAQYVPEGSLIAIDNVNGKVTSVIFDGNVVSGLFIANTFEMTY